MREESHLLFFLHRVTLGCLNLVVTVLVSEPVIRSCHHKQDVCWSCTGEQLGAPLVLLGVYSPFWFCALQNKALATTQQLLSFYVRKRGQKTWDWARCFIPIPILEMQLWICKTKGAAAPWKIVLFCSSNPGISVKYLALSNRICLSHQTLLVSFNVTKLNLSLAVASGRCCAADLSYAVHFFSADTIPAQRDRDKPV